MDQKFKQKAPKRFSLAKSVCGLGCLLCVLSAQTAAQVAPVGTPLGGTSPATTLASEATQIKPDQERRGVTILPGVRNSITYSDNLNIDATGLKQGGFRFEVAPYVFATADSAEAQGFLYYSLRNFYRTTSDKGPGFDDPRHDLRSSGRLRIIDNFLYVRGNAFTYNINPINLSLNSFDPATVRTFDNRFQGFTVAPYIENSLGNFANYNLGYSYGRTSISGFPTVTLDQRLTGNLKSGTAFNSWGWEWDGFRQARSFGTATTFGRNTSTGILYWVVNEEFRVGASARYSQIDGFTNRDGKSSGYGPGLALDYSPSKSTKVKATINKEYYGTTGDFALTHSTPRFSITSAYEKSVLTSSEATFLNQNPNATSAIAAIDGNYSSAYRNFVSQSLYARYGVQAGLGVVDGAAVQRNGGRISSYYNLSPLSKVDLQYQRFKSVTQTTTVNPGLGGFSVVSLSIPLAGQFIGTSVSTGVSAGLEIGLDSRSKFNFKYEYYDNNFLSVARRISLKSVSSTYTTKVSIDTTATVGLRHTAQSGSGFQTSSYSENSMFGALDIRF
jgi:uncharacterized protein (PEP-CTERM system associated)